MIQIESTRRLVAYNAFSVLHYVIKVTLHARLYSGPTQQEYSSKPLKRSIVKRILVFKR